MRLSPYNRNPNQLDLMIKIDSRGTVHCVPETVVVVPVVVEAGVVDEDVHPDVVVRVTDMVDTGVVDVVKGREGVVKVGVVTISTY